MMKFSTKGSLNDAQFIAILKDAAESGLTGMIRLENGPIIKAVYFQKGAISFASSNEKSDRLAEVLSVAGKLTREQVEDAQARLKPNVSLGKTLVELGYISPKDLLWGARAQVDGILHKLLFWTQGKYQIHEGALPREIIHLNLPVASVIFEGIMKTQNRDWVLQHIGSPEAIYALPSDFQDQLQKLKLPVSPVASKLNGKRSLHEIAQLSSVDSFELCKTVVALQYLDLAHPIQDEPLQMALNAPEPTPTLEDQPAPTSMEDVQELGQVLQLPTVEDLQVTGSAGNNPAESAPEKDEQSGVSEVIAEEKVETNEVQHTEPEQDAKIVEIDREKDRIVAEENVENNPVIVATPKKASEPVFEPEKAPEPQPVQIPQPPQVRVPMEDFVDEPEEEETPPRQFRMKQWVTILLVAIAAVGIYLYLQSSRKDQAVPEATTEQQAPAPKPIPVEQPLTHAEVPPADSSSRPRIRAGNLAEAARSWKESLTSANGDYSIQIVIACQEQTVLDIYQLLNESDQMILLPIQFKGQSCYRVLYGQFESKQDANRSIRELPDIFTKQTSPPSVVILSRVLS